MERRSLESQVWLQNKSAIQTVENMVFWMKCNGHSAKVLVEELLALDCFDVARRGWIFSFVAEWSCDMHDWRKTREIQPLAGQKLSELCHRVISKYLLAASFLYAKKLNMMEKILRVSCLLKLGSESDENACQLLNFQVFPFIW